MDNVMKTWTTKAEEGLPTSDFRLPTSHFRPQTSDFRLQTSDFILQTSDFRLDKVRTLDFSFLTVETQCFMFRLLTSHFPLLTSHFPLPTSALASDFRLPTFDFRLPISNFRLPTSNFPLLGFRLPTWLLCQARLPLDPPAGINAQGQGSVERTVVPF